MMAVPSTYSLPARSTEVASTLWSDANGVMASPTETLVGDESRRAAVTTKLVGQGLPKRDRTKRKMKASHAGREARESIFQSSPIVKKELGDYWALKMTVAYNLYLSEKEKAKRRENQKAIVFLIKCLSSQATFSSKHEAALAVFLQVRNSAIRREAAKALMKLAAQEFQTQLRRERSSKAHAVVQWRDREYAICRFGHPQKEKYGTVEREFKLSELPPGIEAGDSFAVDMELDETGRPVSYMPVKTSLHKRVRDPREPVRPELPDNLADKAAVAAYIEKLDAFTRAEFEWVKSQP